MRSNDEETKGIRVMLVIVILGRPPEHLIATLEDIANKINSEKGVEIKSKKINEPIKMKDAKEFYTSFMEIEVEVEEIANLAILMFKYMPAHIEIISPELIALTNNGWNDILNELTRRLHGYDEIARVLMNEKAILTQKLQGLMPKEEADSGKKESLKKKKSSKKKVGHR